GDAVALAQQHARVPELQHEALVAEALLEVDTIRVDLTLDLAPDNSFAGAPPRRGILELREEHAQEQQPDAVGQVVVAVVVREFEVVGDEAPVLEDGLQETDADGRCELWRIGKERG